MVDMTGLKRNRQRRGMERTTCKLFYIIMYNKHQDLINISNLEKINKEKPHGCSNL